VSTDVTVPVLPTPEPSITSRAHKRMGRYRRCIFDWILVWQCRNQLWRQVIQIGVLLLDSLYPSDQKRFNFSGDCVEEFLVHVAKKRKVQAAGYRCEVLGTSTTSANPLGKHVTEPGPHWRRSARLIQKRSTDNAVNITGQRNLRARTERGQTDQQGPVAKQGRVQKSTPLAF